MSKKLVFTALLAALSVTGIDSTFAQDDINCAAIVPQYAALSTDGSLGISFTGENADFSQFTPISQEDPCFGNFAYNEIATSCRRFLDGVGDPIIVIGEPEAITGESCSVQDAEIRKLTKENRRLKNKLKRLTR